MTNTNNTAREVAEKIVRELHEVCLTSSHTGMMATRQEARREQRPSLTTLSLDFQKYSLLVIERLEKEE